MHGINKNINCILQGKERKLVTSGKSDATGTPVTDTGELTSTLHQNVTRHVRCQFRVKQVCACAKNTVQLIKQANPFIHLKLGERERDFAYTGRGLSFNIVSSQCAKTHLHVVNLLPLSH